MITSREQFLEAQKRKDLTLADVETVRRACLDCAEVGAYQGISRPAKYGRTVQENVRINGVTDNIPRIGAPRDLEAGRHLVAEDVEQARSVAVIGTDLVEAFFGSMEPLGREVLFDGRPFKVVGVAEKKGSVFGESQDNFAWVPITTFRKYYGSRRSIVIQAEARSMDVFEATRTRPAWPCASSATWTTRTPTTSRSRPARASWRCGRAPPAASTWSRSWSRPSA